MSNRALVIARVLDREGGIKDVGDGKGLTRFGQTPGWLQQWGLDPPETKDQAALNYAHWLELTRLGEVVDYDVTVGDFVVDYAVHSGEGTAIRALQRAIHVVADGVIGPMTTSALFVRPAGMVARGVLAERLRHIGSLLSSTDVDRRRWARGWCNRLAAQMEALP